MPNCSSFWIISEEVIVMGYAGKGAGEISTERISFPTSNSIKQSRKRTFPYLLSSVSLPSSTIVHPKVKFSDVPG
jgi:hypothetical protein